MCEATKDGHQCEAADQGHPPTHYYSQPSGREVHWEVEGFVRPPDGKPRRPTHEKFDAIADKARGGKKPEPRPEPERVEYGPEAPWNRPSETSRAGAEFIDPFKDEKSHQIWTWLHHHQGATVEQIYMSMGERENTVRPRLWEMRNEDRKHPRPQVVWELDGLGMNTSGVRANRYVTYDPKAPGAPPPPPPATRPWNMEEPVDHGPPVGVSLRDFG